MIDAHNALVIVLMAFTTYLTRILGYVVLHKRALCPRFQAILQAVPGCVLISVVAPFFVTTDAADLCAIAVSVLAASRLPMLAAVLIAMFSAGVLRYLIG